MQIESIVLRTKAGVQLTFSFEEARELYGQLHQLFGSRNILGPLGYTQPGAIIEVPLPR